MLQQHKIMHINTINIFMVKLKTRVNNCSKHGEIIPYMLCPRKTHQCSANFKEFAKIQSLMSRDQHKICIENNVLGATQSFAKYCECRLSGL